MTHNETRRGLLPGELVPLAEAGRRLGLSRSWMRRARLAGLRVHRHGAKLFLHADDFLRFIACAPNDQASANGGEDR